MAHEEKRAWITAIVTLIAYGAYLAVVLGRADGGPLADVPYIAALLWTIGAAIVAAIVLSIATDIAAGGKPSKKDQRDREIERFGEYVGQSFLVIGAVTTMILAMVEAEHFWIANAMYLAFVLSSLLGSVTKIFAYRRGFQTW